MDKRVTVREMIAILQAVDGDLIVESGGCDCWGIACGHLVPSFATIGGFENGVDMPSVVIERGAACDQCQRDAPDE